MGKTDIQAMFGQAVKRRRTELGLSQEMLAELARLHRTYICDVERGTRNVSLQAISQLALALDLPIRSLFRSIPADDAADQHLKPVAKPHQTEYIRRSHSHPGEPPHTRRF